MSNKRLFWIFALSSSVYFIQGIESLPSQALFYYLKENLGFSAEKIMFLGSIITFAWLVKPIIGYIIDRFFTKKTWIYIALLLDIISVFILGFFNLAVPIIILLILLNSSNSAFRDVSVDGIMCVEGKELSATGRIQSVQWISLSVASIIAGISGGYIAQRWDYKFAFLCLVPFYIICGVIAFFYKEKNVFKIKRDFKRDMQKLFSHKDLLIVALFIFLYKYSPSFGTPLFFIQRDVFKWSKLWIGFMATLSSLCEIIGALFYYRFSQRIKIKKWLFFSVFLGAITTLSYLYYTPVSAVIYNIVYSVVGMFIFVMVLDFMARNTIAGLEATSFAFLCSVSNLAGSVSGFSGAILYPVVGLRWLIVISSLTSFLCLFLINKVDIK
ncbi:MAG: MFS transporter [Candidatus Omnitrophica bacterium]|nr:MFS transporter [Candidatus Omnitrophota bacterium]MCM8799676.1 MFS transporter [Candidatus Omnitrophota bacterium]